MSKVLVEGTLEVRQSRGDLPRQWTVLYCRLFKDGIRYYNYADDPNELGVIQMSQIEEVQNLEETKKSESGPPTFEIRSLDKGRTQHRCPDSKILQLWVYKIDTAKTAESVKSLQSGSQLPKQDLAASSDEEEDDDDTEQAVTPAGTMVIRKKDLDRVNKKDTDDSSGSLDRKDKKKSKPKHRGKNSGSSRSPKVSRASETSSSHSRATSTQDVHNAVDDNDEDEEIDYSNMGTMQINSSSTVEVKNTSELFFQHVADMKLNDRIRYWDTHTTVELKEQLNGKLQETYEAEYTETIKAYNDKRSQLLEQLRDLEIKEAQQRFDTENSSTASKIAELKKRM